MLNQSIILQLSKNDKFLASSSAITEQHTRFCMVQLNTLPTAELSIGYYPDGSIHSVSESSTSFMHFL